MFFSFEGMYILLGVSTDRARKEPQFCQSRICRHFGALSADSLSTRFCPGGGTRLQSVRHRERGHSMRTASTHAMLPLPGQACQQFMAMIRFAGIALPCNLQHIRSDFCFCFLEEGCSRSRPGRPLGDNMWQHCAVRSLRCAEQTVSDFTALRNPVKYS